jgi:hypothetical protein
LGKTPHDDADFDLAHDHGPSDLAGGRCAMNENREGLKLVLAILALAFIVASWIS